MTYPEGSQEAWLQRHLPEIVRSVREFSGRWAPVHEMSDEHVQGILVALARSGWMSMHAPYPRCKHCKEPIGYIGKKDMKPMDPQQWCHVNEKGEWVSFDCHITRATPEDHP